MDKFTEIISKLKPSKLIDVSGNKEIIEFLTKVISIDAIPNAMIFYGDIGSGKTLSARLFVKNALCTSKDSCGKCYTCSNVIYKEFNSSNYTQIDDIRNIIDDMQSSPIFFDKQFYILDEFHMLSSKSFSALLKEIEEPPINVKFIFITNEIGMIPETLISRCFTLHFKNVSFIDRVNSINLFLMQNADFFNNRQNTYKQEDIELIAKESKTMRETINNLAGFILTGKFINVNKFNKSDVLLQKIELNIEEAIEFAESLRKRGLSGKDILINLIEQVISSKEFSYKVKSDLIDIFSDSFKRVIYFERSYISALIRANLLLSDWEDA